MTSSPPVKRHGLADWIGKQNTLFCFFQETYLTSKDRYHNLRVKG